MDPLNTYPVIESLCDAMRVLANAERDLAEAEEKVGEYYAGYRLLQPEMDRLDSARRVFADAFFAAVKAVQADKDTP